jgi:hypothetical protein
MAVGRYGRFIGFVVSVDNDARVQDVARQALGANPQLQ